MSMTKKIGVVGVGAMGRGIAHNLLKAGYSVKVFDLNKEAVQALVSEGAVSADSPFEIGKDVDFVLTSLPSSAAFEDTLLGEQGLLKSLSSGSFVIDFSTIDPITTRKIHKIAAYQGVKTLDAPVSGGPQGAMSGTLTIMVGGDKEDFAACRELFEIIGKKVFHVGPIGAGQTIKLCNNALAAVHTVALGEVLLTGVKAGVDLNVLVEVISSSSGNCWILQNFFPKTVLANQYDPPLFALNLMHKDVGLYMKTAEELGIPSIMGGIAYQMYKAGKAMGKGPQDHTSVVQVVEELANDRIVTVE